MINTGLTSGYCVNDRYRIVKQLGHGGFGRTYLAQDTNRFDEPCVLKEFAPQLRGSYALEKAEELFEREAGTLYRLKHCQIPRFRELFRFDYQGEGRLLLAQDYVEGQTYHELLNQRLQQGKEFTVAEASLLLWQTLPVLDYIHSSGVIHRDISPDNLILRDSDGMTVLIDFGSIKEFASKAQSQLPEILNTTETFSGVVGTVLGKMGYAPPEQMERGIVKENSDLYSLAATTVVLLTGKEPGDLINPDTLQWEWQQHRKINPQLAEILNKMLAPNGSDRFKSAKEVMQALNNNSSVLSCVSNYQPNFQPFKQTNQSCYLPSSLKQWLTLACVTGLTLAGSWGLNHHLMTNYVPQPNSSAQISQTTNLQLSQGENVLISAVMTPEKQLGVAAFGQGNYTQAVNLFSASLKKQPNDPETLIYLNNARIGDKTAYTIAVSLPISTNVNMAQEMLRGIAQGQAKINQAGGRLIKILIINDHSAPEIGQQIAHYLSQKTEVLGLIGHGDSEVTLSAMQTYEKNQLTVISPVSTAIELSNLSPYLFRTVPSDYMTGRTLGEQMLQQQKLKKVAVFYDSSSSDSNSLKTEFITAVNLGGGQIVGQYDLSRSDFSATQSLKQASSNKAEVIMIANDSQTLDRSLQVIQVNQKKLPILGGPELCSPKTLEIVGRLAENIILAIPWHIQPHENSEFVQNARQQWGAEINWPTATAYEAILAFSTAINQSPTRVGVQQTLSDTNFSIQAMSQSLRFFPSGDRQQGMEQVTVRPSQHSQFG
ncbi:MAG: ABC transporter substrate-binding protein, partial [Microcystaceae cyanobacterium]